MSVVRYEPWVLMNRLSRDLERLFNVPADGGDDTRSAVVDWVPAVDIKEEDEQFVIHADLPGVDAKDIDVTLEKGVLTIRGQRANESREEKDGYRRVERVSGQFFRRFSLPDTADSTAVKAKFVNGVLEVQIPKQPSVLPRRIAVDTH